MDPGHLSAFLIVALLLGLAGAFGWRQRQALLRLSQDATIAEEDRLYLFNQAWRRLVGCGLMICLAALLAGWFLSGLNERADRIGDLAEAQRIEGGALQLDDEQKHSVRLFSLYWIVTLLVLLAFLSTAAFDLWAIHRYGKRHRNQIHADRKAMLEGELARIRSQRNGHV